MTKLLSSAFAWGVASIGLILAAPASAALSNNAESRIVFKATGPAGLSFEGKGRDIKLKENGNNVIVSVKLDGLATGIELRDRHMKEKYLETGKYPTATLEVDKSKLRFPEGSAVNGSTEGKLTLHGVSKIVKVSYHADGDKNQAKVDGSMHINMKDFKIEVPNYLGVTVKPNVDVEVKLGVVNK
jgi:polyisoprenoid-binding protein YceI